MLNHRLCIAPMMGYTHRHFRYFIRLITHHSYLYSEMITSAAILINEKVRSLLDFNAIERPVALQLGGSNPKDLQECTKIATDKGYSEINLNVGCPSKRVRAGHFGACLMYEPALVARCVEAMRISTHLPVSVKTRIGVDNLNDYSFLSSFVKQLSDAGCHIIILHARIALLQGVNPKYNRTIPPLDYNTVYQIKKDFPHLTIIINGGVQHLHEALHHLNAVDGVMLGRMAIYQPYQLRSVDHIIYAEKTAPLSLQTLFECYLEYARREWFYKPAKKIIQPLYGLLHKLPHARTLRRWLNDGAWLTSNPPQLITMN